MIFIDFILLYIFLWTPSFLPSPLTITTVSLFQKHIMEEYKYIYSWLYDYYWSQFHHDHYIRKYLIVKCQTLLPDIYNR